jgi:hypothetical protein
MVVKPDQSVRAEASDRKNFAVIVSDRRELEAAVQGLLAGGSSVLLQEFIAGRGVGVEVLACEGRILTAFQHVRIHETTGHGSTYRKSVPLDPRLLEWTERLFADMEFTGLAMAEYRVGAKAVLLEVNARMWGSMPLAVAAGASFPRHLYRLLVEGDRHPSQAYRTGVRSCDPCSDTRWMLRSLLGSARSDRGPDLGLEDELGQALTGRGSGGTRAAGTGRGRQFFLGRSASACHRPGSYGSNPAETARTSAPSFLGVLGRARVLGRASRGACCGLENRTAPRPHRTVLRERE